MEPQAYKSYKFKNKLIDFLVPSKSAIGLYFVFALLILCILNYIPIKNLVFGTSLGDIQEVALYSEKLTTVWNWLGNIIVWLFWGVAGLTIYAIIWFIQNGIMVAEEEREESEFLAPNIQAKKSYWQSNIASNLLFFALLFIWIAYFVFISWLNLGLLSSLFVNGLYNMPDIVAIIFLVLSVVLSMMTIYGLQLVSELLAHAWKIVKPQKT